MHYDIETTAKQWEMMLQTIKNNIERSKDKKIVMQRKKIVVERKPMKVKRTRKITEEQRGAFRQRMIENAKENANQQSTRI